MFILSEISLDDEDLLSAGLKQTKVSVEKTNTSDIYSYPVKVQSEPISIKMRKISEGSKLNAFIWDADYRPYAFKYSCNVQ